MNKEYNDVFTSRAILDLHGFFLVTTEYDIIENPVIIFKTLRTDELYLLSYIEELSKVERGTIYEEIIRDNVVEIFGHPGAIINPAYSPAGIVDSVAEAVLHLTYKYLVNEDNSKFDEAYMSATFLESMQAIIAHYLNISYERVCEMPLQEIFKKYAICAKTFPQQVSMIEPIKEGE